ncbi:serine hydrolase [Bacteroides helcogenes]|uniref:Beta-lactamase n=1 Tax=Bacteroides helcogenes (strain ATCC 35417 / DSM 20613 / JCM 6297 / CCUG 15421 / P 36-108) TaxID=693979 RepID=E6STS2_BACT6|nr:serine hydrolase [Bacteroides helcogenes]ADV42275.1 beta-lactamase [Bacteroides helcogenes P 36-108]MDY5237271.1 serine hydrolase [Bacteroides helcogenes]
MKKYTFFLWITGLLLVSPLIHVQAYPSLLPSASDDRGCQWADSVLSRMSMQEKIGQLIVATIPAKADKENKKQIQELIRKYKVGGLLFAEGTPEEQAILTNMAQKAATVPVMVAFDGEQGLSAWLKGVPDYPRNAALGCIEDDSLIEEYGRERARQFRELGININLIPVAGVNADPLIYVHPFGENSGSAARKAEAYERGLVSGGIMVGYSSFLSPAVGEKRKEESASGELTFANVQEMKGVSNAARITAKALLAGNDMLLTRFDTKNAVAGLMEAVRSGVLSSEMLDARCRKVLMCKYKLGLAVWSGLRVSGMSYRINTERAQLLATRLRHSAVTLLNNYFDVLPLSPNCGSIALLSLGDGGGDTSFGEAMKKHADVSNFCLSWNADETAREEVRRKLMAYRRIVISVTGSAYISDKDVKFLNELELQAPLVYAFFTPYRTLLSLLPALSKASAVVLAHSAEAGLQQYVADVLFAKASAVGKTSMSIGRTFPAGTGCDIVPGMKPGIAVPEDYGMKSYILHGIDNIACSGVAAGAYPGCRIMILKDGHTVYDKGFGTHSDKDTTTVRPDDLFDLASLTKTTATLLAVMKLYDEGKLKLEDKVSEFLPFLRGGNKKDITIRELLLHESGLPPYLRFYVDAIDPNSVHGPYSQSWIDEWHRTQVSEHSYYCSDFKFRKGLMSDKPSAVYSLHVADGMWLNKDFKNTILQRIARCELDGKRYVYSDLGFVLLQQVVEAIVQLPMDLYLAREFYAPMGLQRTMFLPLRRFSKEEIMPTASNDFLRRQDLCGYVHDETAACMGGISGNAGLFSTADEVAKVYQMLLNGGELNGKRFLSEATCRLFTTERSSVSRRGLGFDRPDVSAVQYSPCAASASAGVYGHTGFTGTCVWVDPENKTVYVFLSNHLCPNVWSTKLGDMNIRTDIQELIFKSCTENRGLN